MSSQPLLVVVVGLPCTGKTTIAKEIATRLNYPLIFKDGIKEILFDNLGLSDRSWSKKLSKTTYDVMFHIIEAMLSTGNSLVVEGNFPPQIARKSFINYTNSYPCLTFEVLCVVESRVLLQRFAERRLSGTRHPGHLDYEVIREVKNLIAEGHDGHLDLGGGFYKADSTKFAPSLSSVITGKITAYLDMMNG
jgi:predicted kinase